MAMVVDTRQIITTHRDNKKKKRLSNEINPAIKSRSLI